MPTYNVIHIDSQRESRVGTVDAKDADEALENAVDLFADENDKDRDASKFRVAAQSLSDMTCYRVFVAGQSTEHKVWADSQELALEMAERDYGHLYNIDEIGVG